jgi:hygromycin-B 7''-O-kinase
MPEVETLDDYRAIYHRDDVWRPAIDEIRSRHGISGEACRRGPDGTHVVYFSGESHVVKLFVPLFERDFEAERLVAGRLGGRLGLTTPEILYDGEIGGWRYLVMTRVPGRPLKEVWSRTADTDRRGVVVTIGETIAQLRALSVAGLDELAVDWTAFVRRQIETGADRQIGSRVTWDPAVEIPAYLRSVPELPSEHFEPVLLLADMTDEHVLVTEHGGSWRAVSYVDFGDAMVGHPDYELVAPGLTVAAGDGRLLRALLVAAGYPESRLNEALGRRLMAYTLLHRYVRLDDILTLVPRAREAGSLEELARTLWPVW